LPFGTAGIMAKAKWASNSENDTKGLLMIEQEYLNRWAEWHSIEKRDGVNSDSEKSAHFDALTAWRNLPDALQIQLMYRKLGPSHSEDDARDMARVPR